MIEGGERYLVVRLTALGDILHTLPAVAAIRAAHKNARIDWVVERKWAPGFRRTRMCAPVAAEQLCLRDRFSGALQIVGARHAFRRASAHRIRAWLGA